MVTKSVHRIQNTQSISAENVTEGFGSVFPALDLFSDGFMYLMCRGIKGLYHKGFVQIS